MDRDPLDDLPAESRAEVIAEVRAVLGVDAATAEDLVRSAEPFWDAMERAGGLVDSWGGGEFRGVFPRLLSFVRSAANPGYDE
jgi:hypothetical protein